LEDEFSPPHGVLYSSRGITNQRKRGICMANSPAEQSVDDVALLPLEDQKFHAEFKRYFRHKRGNFLKAMTEFADLWECFQLLNDIWMREMADLNVLRDKDQLLPRMLFTAAHSKFISALELGFSCCIGDAYSLLRDGIEFTAHAHKIFSEPSVTQIWADKMKGKAHTGAYDKIFTHEKKKNLFPHKLGLKPLHFYYAQLSEIGTHSNTISLGKSFKDLSTPQRISWGFAYFETDPKKIATFLFTMLVIAGHMEETFFGCYGTRLNLDYELVNMRTKFNAMKEQQRHFLRTKYKIGTAPIRYR